MANFQIKLTPVETFFFGGEKHSINTSGEPVSDYFSESSLYPQQTTLLGLTRYLLLIKNDTIFKKNKIIDKAKASEYIGESSFDFSNQASGYGKIRTISSLYFTYGEENYFFAPLDYGSNLLENFVLEKEIDNEIEEYTAKEKNKFLQQIVVSNSFHAKMIEDIVKSSPMVGNEKAENGTSKEDAFYKQNMKYLAAGWSFAFDSEIEEDAGISDIDELFVPFGGEKCYFKVEISKKPKAEPTVPTNYRRNQFTVILLSDSFLVDTSLLNKSDFAINDFVSFRNLQSTVGTTQKYSGLSNRDPVQLKRSSRYNLLKRGSVLYFNNKENFDEVKTAIGSNKNLTNIGFNHILTINK